MNTELQREILCGAGLIDTKRVTLYLFESHDVFVNLAKEEALFTNLGPAELIIILYVNDRSVVIGRNQNPWIECPKLTIDALYPFARRNSGGGAVYHDLGNLNFSFMGVNTLSNETISRIMIDFLGELGFIATQGEKHDLLVDSKKISGRASYYRGTKVMHHGTLLVESDLALLQQTLAKEPMVTIATSAVPSRAAHTMNLKQIEGTLTVSGAQSALAQYLKQIFSYIECWAERGDPLTPLHYQENFRRHLSWSWRFGRTPYFQCNLMNSQGEFALAIEVAGGMIKQVVNKDSAAIERSLSLIDRRFELARLLIHGGSYEGLYINQTAERMVV